MELPSPVAKPLQLANQGLAGFNDPSFVGEVVARVFAREEIEVRLTRGIARFPHPRIRAWEALMRVSCSPTMLPWPRCSPADAHRARSGRRRQGCARRGVGSVFPGLLRFPAAHGSTRSGCARGAAKQRPNSAPPTRLTSASPRPLHEWVKFWGNPAKMADPESVPPGK